MSGVLRRDGKSTSKNIGEKIDSNRPRKIGMEITVAFIQEGIPRGWRRREIAQEEKKVEVDSMEAECIGKWNKEMR